MGVYQIGEGYYGIDARGVKISRKVRKQIDEAFKSAEKMVPRISYEGSERPLNQSRKATRKNLRPN